MRAPPPDTGTGFARLGDLGQFAVARIHPLVREEERLAARRSNVFARDCGWR